MTSNTNDIIRPAYLNREQIAKRLGLSLRTVATMMAARQLPFVRLRGRVLFDPVAVDAHIAKHNSVPAVR